MSSIDRPRVRGWVVRYLPLEVLGTLAALGSAWIAYRASGSLAVAALAGALGESIGYYALVVPAEIVDSFLVRPGLLWAASLAWGGNLVAWLVGKLAADAVFYLVAIVSFETGRRIILPDGGLAEASADDVVSESLPEGALR